MKITQIRNATLHVDYNRTCFLLDPWLGPKGYMPGFEGAFHSEVRQPRTELPFGVEQIAAADAVILTHVHPDHWDDFAAKALRKDIPFFVQSETDRQYIAAQGFTQVSVLSEQGTPFRGTVLYRTGGQHGERAKVEPVCKKMGMPYDAMGVVFQAPEEPTLYVAGDTIFCPELCHALDTYHPDVVVVNACGARVLTGDRLIMVQEDVKQVADYAPHAVIVASHMDAVSHLTVTREDLRQFVQANHLSQVKIPADGETLEFHK